MYSFSHLAFSKESLLRPNHEPCAIYLLAYIWSFHFFLAALSVKSKQNVNGGYKLEVQGKDLEVVLTPVFLYSV